MKEEDDNILVVSSDSDEDESSIWIKKCKNKQFQLLWGKVQPIIFHYVLPEYKSTYFPYAKFQELAEDLRKSLTLVYVESTQAFIWKNLIRWLVSMKLCYEGISDLRYDERYNLILTEFMSQYMNYKCNLYSTITDETEVCRRVDEILVTLGVVFSGNIPSILMTLLKIEVKDVYRLILDPIFRKYLSNRSLHEPNDLISYLRLILCYRQWKKLAHFKEDKELINEIAVGKSEKSLKSQTESMAVNLTTREAVLPKMVPPVNETNRPFSVIAGLIGFAIRNKAYGTRILLINKSLDLEETIVKYFQQYEKYISRNDSILCESTRALRIFDDYWDSSGSSSPIPKPMRMQDLKRSPSGNHFLTDDVAQHKEEEEEGEEEQELQNENNIDKQGTNAVNQHLSIDCDISRISNALKRSNLSSNSEQLSLSFKRKPQNRNSNVQLSALHNKKSLVIELDTTDDDDDDDNDNDNNDDDDKNTRNNVSCDKQTDRPSSPMDIELSYIERLKQRAISLESRLGSIRRNSNVIRRNSVVLISSSDEDEAVAPVIPTRQAGSGSLNTGRGGLNALGPEVNPIPERVSRRMGVHGERPPRKEKLRCITGEVSSTTSLDCSSALNAENSPVRNVGTLENAREVGTLSAVRTSRVGELANTDYSDISDNYAGPSNLTGGHLVSRLCSIKFSKVVEEATSSTSEIPMRAGSEAPPENVIFSIHPYRPRRSTSSSPCPTRNNSPIDGCPNNAPSSTIRTGSRSRITVRRLNSLIGVADDGGRPTPTLSFDDDSEERGEEIRQNSERVSGLSLDSVSDDCEIATCSRYVVGSAARLINRNSVGKRSREEAGRSEIHQPSNTVSDSEVATCSRYVGKKVSIVSVETFAVPVKTSIASEDKAFSAIAENDSSDLNKFLNDISAHIGEEHNSDDSTEQVQNVVDKTTSNQTHKATFKSSKSANVEHNERVSGSLSDTIYQNREDVELIESETQKSEPQLSSAKGSLKTNNEDPIMSEKQPPIFSIKKQNNINSEIIAKQKEIKISEPIVEQVQLKNSTPQNSARSESLSVSSKVLNPQKVQAAIRYSALAETEETVQKIANYESELAVSNVVQPSIEIPLESSNTPTVLKRPDEPKILIESIEVLENNALHIEDVLIETPPSPAKDISVDNLATNLIEEELSNDEEIESPAYEPICPKTPEESQKIDEISSKITEAKENEDVERTEDPITDASISKNEHISRDQVSNETKENFCVDTNQLEVLNSEIVISKEKMSNEPNETLNIEDHSTEISTSDQRTYDQIMTVEISDEQIFQNEKSAESATQEERTVKHSSTENKVELPIIKEQQRQKDDERINEVSGVLTEITETNFSAQDVLQSNALSDGHTNICVNADEPLSKKQTLTDGDESIEQLGAKNTTAIEGEPPVKQYPVKDQPLPLNRCHVEDQTLEDACHEYKDKHVMSVDDVSSNVSYEISIDERKSDVTPVDALNILEITKPVPHSTVEEESSSAEKSKVDKLRPFKNRKLKIRIPSMTAELRKLARRKSLTIKDQERDTKSDSSVETKPSDVCTASDIVETSQERPVEERSPEQIIETQNVVDEANKKENSVKKKMTTQREEDKGYERVMTGVMIECTEKQGISEPCIEKSIELEAVIPDVIHKEAFVQVEKISLDLTAIDQFKQKEATLDKNKTIDESIEQVTPKFIENNLATLEDVTSSKFVVGTFSEKNTLKTCPIEEVTPDKPTRHGEGFVKKAALDTSKKDVSTEATDSGKTFFDIYPIEKVKPTASEQRSIEEVAFDKYTDVFIEDTGSEKTTVETQTIEVVTPEKSTRVEFVEGTGLEKRPVEEVTEDKCLGKVAIEGTGSEESSVEEVTSDEFAGDESSESKCSQKSSNATVTSDKSVGDASIGGSGSEESSGEEVTSDKFTGDLSSEGKCSQKSSNAVVTFDKSVGDASIGGSSSEESSGEEVTSDKFTGDVSREGKCLQKSSIAAVTSDKPTGDVSVGDTCSEKSSVDEVTSGKFTADVFVENVYSEISSDKEVTSDKCTGDLTSENNCPQKSSIAEVTPAMPLKISIEDISAEKKTAEIHPIKEVTHDKSTGDVFVEVMSSGEEFIETFPDKSLTMPRIGNKILEFHKENASVSNELETIVNNKSKQSQDIVDIKTTQSHTEKLDTYIGKSKVEFGHTTRENCCNKNIMSIKPKTKTQAQDEFSMNLLASPQSNIESKNHTFEKMSAFKSDKKSSPFNSCSSEAVLPLLLNLRRTEVVPTEEDSNLSTQVQVAAEDLGDPTLSFDSGENSPVYQSNEFETPRNSPVDYTPKQKTTFIDSTYLTEDQEVSNITSQDTVENLTYNTYHDDCGTPVLDEKDGDEIESPPASQRKTVSLSILKEIPNLPPVSFDLARNQAFSNQNPSYQHAPRSLPKSAGVLVMDNPNHFSRQLLPQVNQEDPVVCPVEKVIPKPTKSGFIEPSPKPKPTIETDSEYQKTPLKVRIKRRMSQCADINEEFNSSPKVQFMGMCEELKPIPVPSYNVPLDLVIRPDKISTKAKVGEKIPQTPNSDKDPLSLDEEDQNQHYQESWFKKLGKLKSSHKTLPKEIHSPTMTQSPKGLCARSEEVPTNGQVIQATTHEECIANPPGNRQTIRKNEGRRRKPKRVKKLTEQSEVMTDDSSAECHHMIPITANVMPLEQATYNPEDIKAANILSDMLKKSNKVDESQKIKFAMPTKTRKTSKQKTRKQTQAQCTRLTRSTSHMIEKLPLSDAPITPPITPNKLAAKREFRKVKTTTSKKNDFISSTESIWQPEKTQEILRSVTTTSTQSLLRTSESDVATKNITEGLALMNAGKSSFHLYCSSDSDDGRKLVIDLGDKRTSHSKQKSKGKVSRNRKRKGSGGKMALEKKVTELLQIANEKAESNKQISPPVVKYDENILLSSNSVFKLTSEVDVFVPSGHRPELPKATDNYEDITISPTNRMYDQKSTDDEVAQFYPIVQLTEDVEFTPKTRAKRDRKQTSIKARNRSAVRRILDVSKDEEPENALVSPLAETKRDSKSRSTSKSKQPAKPKYKQEVEIKFESNSITESKSKPAEKSQPILCCKTGLFNNQSSDRKSVDNIDERITVSELKPKTRKQRLSFGIDTILGNRIDSPKSVQEKSPSEGVKLESTSPQIAMNKEMWLTTFSLRKTSKSLDEVVKELSEAKPKVNEMLKSPTGSTPAISPSTSTEHILLQDLKALPSPTECSQPGRVRNRRKSLVTAKTKPQSNATTTATNEIDILKIKELKELQPIKNRRKSSRNTMRIVSAELNQNSEEDDSVKDDTSAKSNQRNQLSREGTVDMTGISESAGIDKSKPTATKTKLEESASQSAETIEEVLKCTKGTHKVKTIEVKAKNKHAIDVLKCTDASQSSEADETAEEKQQRLKDILKSKTKIKLVMHKISIATLKCTDASQSMKTMETSKQTQDQFKETLESKETAKHSILKQRKSVDALKCSNEIQEQLKGTSESKAITKKKSVDALKCTDASQRAGTVETSNEVPEHFKETPESKPTTKPATLNHTKSVDVLKCTDETQEQLKGTSQSKATARKKSVEVLKYTDPSQSEETVQTLNEAQDQLKGTSEPKSTIKSKKTVDTLKCTDALQPVETVQTSEEVQEQIKETPESKAIKKPTLKHKNTADLLKGMDETQEQLKVTTESKATARKKSVASQLVETVQTSEEVQLKEASKATKKPPTLKGKKTVDFLESKGETQEQLKEMTMSKATTKPAILILKKSEEKSAQNKDIKEQLPTAIPVQSEQKKLVEKALKSTDSTYSSDYVNTLEETQHQSKEKAACKATKAKKRKRKERIECTSMMKFPTFNHKKSLDDALKYTEQSDAPEAVEIPNQLKETSIKNHIEFVEDSLTGTETAEVKATTNPSLSTQSTSAEDILESYDTVNVVHKQPSKNSAVIIQIKSNEDELNCSDAVPETETAKISQGIQDQLKETSAIKDAIKPSVSEQRKFVEDALKSSDNLPRTVTVETSEERQHKLKESSATKTASKSSAPQQRNSAKDALKCSDTLPRTETVENSEEPQHQLKESSGTKAATMSSAPKQRKSVEDVLNCSDSTHITETIRTKGAQKQFKEITAIRATTKPSARGQTKSVEGALIGSNVLAVTKTLETTEEDQQQLKETSATKASAKHLAPKQRKSVEGTLKNSNALPQTETLETIEEAQQQLKETPATKAASKPLAPTQRKSVEGALKSSGVLPKTETPEITEEVQQQLKETPATKATSKTLPPKQMKPVEGALKSLDVLPETKTLETTEEIQQQLKETFATKAISKLLAPKDRKSIEGALKSPDALPETETPEITGEVQQQLKETFATKATSKLLAPKKINLVKGVPKSSDGLPETETLETTEEAQQKLKETPATKPTSKPLAAKQRKSVERALKSSDIVLKTETQEITEEAQQQLKETSAIKPTSKLLAPEQRKPVEGCLKSLHVLPETKTLETTEEAQREFKETSATKATSKLLAAKQRKSVEGALKSSDVVLKTETAEITEEAHQQLKETPATKPKSRLFAPKERQSVEDTLKNSNALPQTETLEITEGPHQQLKETSATKPTSKLLAPEQRKPVEGALKSLHVLPETKTLETTEDAQREFKETSATKATSKLLAPKQRKSVEDVLKRSDVLSETKTLEIAEEDQQQLKETPLAPSTPRQRKSVDDALKTSLQTLETTAEGTLKSSDALSETEALETSEEAQQQLKETPATKATLKPLPLKQRKSVEGALKSSDVLPKTEAPDITEKAQQQPSASKGRKSTEEALKFVDASSKTETVDDSKETQCAVPKPLVPKQSTKEALRYRHTLSLPSIVNPQKTENELKERELELGEPKQIISNENSLKSKDALNTKETADISEKTQQKLVSFESSRPELPSAKLAASNQNNLDLVHLKSLDVPTFKTLEMTQPPLRTEKTAKATHRKSDDGYSNTIDSTSEEKGKCGVESCEVEIRPKSTKVDRERKRKSIDVSNDVTPTEIQTNGEETAEAVKKDITDKTSKSKLIVEIRRLSIDDTNLKMTIEKPSEVIEEVNEHSNTQAKKTKKLQKSLAIAKSTETDDTTGRAVFKDRECQADLEIQKSNDLKTILSEGTTVTVESNKLLTENELPVADSVSMGLLVVEPVKDLKEAADEVSGENNQLVDTAENTIQKSETKEIEGELANTSDVEPILKLKKEEELPSKVNECLELALGETVDPSKEVDSKELTAVQDLKLEAVEVVTNEEIQTDSEQKLVEKSVRSICRITRSAETKLQPTEPKETTKSQSACDVRMTTHALERNDMTTVETLQSAGVFSVVEAVQDSKENVDQKAGQPVVNEILVERPGPKSRKKSRTATSNKRPIVLLKKCNLEAMRKKLQTSSKMREILTEKNTPNSETQSKRKRISLDCNRSLTSSPISLRTRSHSTDVNIVLTETPLKKIKLTPPTPLNSEHRVDNHQVAATVAQELEIVTTEAETNSNDEVQRVAEQLELSIKNILGNQLSETNADGSSVSMSKILLTNRPQGFDSVPDDIFAGNGDTCDTLEAKFYPTILNAEDLMLKSPESDDSHQTDEPENEGGSLKTDVEDGDDDCKEPPLKKSRQEEAENKESENSASTSNSAPELELDPFAMTNIGNSSVFEENYIPELIVQSDRLTSVVNNVIDELTPFQSSDCMISGNYGHKFDNDVPLYLLEPPLLFLEQDTDSMISVSPFDVLRNIPKRNNLTESFTSPDNEVPTDVELDCENELFSYSGLMSIQIRDSSSSSNEKGLVSTPVEMGNVDKSLLTNFESKPDHKDDDTVFKKPNSVQMSIEETPSNVAQQNAVNYYAPAVEVSTEVGFESYDELLAGNHYFASSVLEKSERQSQSSAETETNADVTPPANMETERNSGQSESNEPEPLSDSKQTCRDEKPTPIPIVSGNVTDNKPTNAAKERDKETVVSSMKKKHTLTPETVISPLKLQCKSTPFWRKKSNKSKPIVESELHTPKADVEQKLNPAESVQNASSLESNTDIASSLTDDKLNSPTETVDVTPVSSTEDIAMQKDRSLPAILSLTDEVQTKVPSTKLPDLSDIIDKNTTFESDLPTDEPLSKKPRLEAVSKLSTDDLFDRLKRESPVNPLMRTSKPALIKASSFESDDNSSRDSVLGLINVPTSPAETITDVISPSTTSCESSPLPSSSPAIVPSMPLIFPPPRLESSPKRVEPIVPIDEPKPKPKTKHLIKDTNALPKTPSSPVPALLKSNTLSKPSPSNNDIEKVKESLPKSSTLDTVETTNTNTQPVAGSSPIPACVKSDQIARSSLKRTRWSNDLEKVYKPSSPDVVRKSSHSSLKHSVTKTELLPSLNPSKPVCVTKPSTPSTVDAKSPRVTFSPLVTKMPELDPFTMRKLPSLSSSSSETSKPIKSILVSSQSKSSSSRSNSSSPSETPKPIKSILISAPSKSPSSRTASKSPSQSQKPIKSISTPLRISSSRLDAVSPSQSPKPIKPVLTSPAAPLAYKNTPLRTSSSKLDVGSPAQSPKPIKPVLTSPATPLAYKSTPLRTSSSRLDVGSPAQSPKPIKPVLTSPATPLAYKSTPLRTSSSRLDVGSPAQSPKPIKPVLTSPATPLVYKSTPLRTSSSRLDVGSPAQSPKPIKPVLTSPATPLAHKNTHSTKSSSTPKRTLSTPPITSTTSKSSCVSHDTVVSLEAEIEIILADLENLGTCHVYGKYKKRCELLKKLEQKNKQLDELKKAQKYDLLSKSR